MFIQVDQFDLQSLLSYHRKNKYRKPQFSQNFSTESMLDYSNSKIERPPISIFTQKSIKILNLNDNFIKKFEIRLIKDMQNLQNLLLRNNLLQDFEPQYCTQLVVLDLSLNHIKIIRPQIGDMTKLKQMYIAHNNFTELPIELLKLRKSLHLFQLDWMKYSNPPTPELIADKFTLCDFFQALEESFLDFQISNDQSVISFSQFINHTSYSYYSKKHHQEQIQTNRSVEDFKICKEFKRKCSQSVDGQKKAPNKVHKAVVNEDLGVLRALIEEKYKIDELDKNDHSALSLAIQEEKYLAAKYLLYSNANPNIGGSWFGSCLNLAVSKLQFYLVRDLIQKGASLCKLDQYQNDCIQYLFAVWTNNTKEAEQIGDLLQKQHINPNRMNMNGYTVVHLVSKMGNIDGLKYMLRWNEKEKDEEYKFNFEVKTKNEKNTVLHQASYSRNAHLIQLIASKFGEQINQKNITDQSPLEFLRQDQLCYKIVKKYEKLYKNAILETTIRQTIIDMYQVSDDDISSKHNDLISNDGSILKNERVQMKFQSLTRTIPFSPNNLQILEGQYKNYRIDEYFRNKVRLLKEISYELKQVNQNQNYYLNLLQQDLKLADIIANILILKKMYYLLNKLILIIDQQPFKQQWNEFVEMQAQLKEDLSIYEQYDNISTYSKLTNNSFSRGLLKLFSTINRILETIFQNHFQKDNNLLQNFHLPQLDYFESYQLNLLLLEAFLSLHNGYGLQRMVLFINQKNCYNNDVLLQYEIMQTKLSIKTQSNYNIMNQKLFLKIFNL